MFKRLFLDTWDGLIPILGFTLTALAFLIIVVRAVRMKKPEATRMASLPLEDGKGDTFPNDHGY